MEHNTISDDTYGVWLTPATVIAPHLGRNRYSVSTPVFYEVRSRTQRDPGAKRPRPEAGEPGRGRVLLTP